MARLSLTEVGLLLLLVLALFQIFNAEAKQKRSQTLRRKKREWFLPPTKLLENTDYTEREFIAKIRSDKDTDTKVEYYLSGPGANKPPFNLFVVDHDTGFVRITGILDREKYPSFNLKGIAKYRDGTTAEDDIPLTITVLDQNDNAPYFELHTGNVTEASKKGTFVMQIEGKDDDQAGTINAEISYSIISQEPEGTGHMFTIDENTGKLYVREPTLDRETYDFYKLVIKGTDLGGAPGGLTGTGTVEIKVLDINDNIPILEKSEYTGSVDENVADVVVMRIKALDKDLEHTDNWLTVFKILKGNKDNLFSIETDKETNEGILKLIKPVDFEEVQNIELGLLIENVAPFVEGGAIAMDVDVQVGEGGPLVPGANSGIGIDVAAGVDMGIDMGQDADLKGGGEVKLNPESGFGPVLVAGVKPGLGVGLIKDVKPGSSTKPNPHAPLKGYPIKIAVNNVPEGPEFIPDTKTVPISEDPNEAPKDGVILVFAAVDPDTGKPAEDVSYAKAYDPDNWFTIEEETAEIKLNKLPDRESPFLVNGTYIAKILAMTKDMPSKTATGTIAIQVTDSNDHCPILTTIHSSLCSNEKTVFVTGFDEDATPNSAPFTFRIIPDGTQGSWFVEVINETSAALHSKEELWPGSYQLQVEVLDAQGLSCLANEVLTVDVCTCVETVDCSLQAARLATTPSELSALAICLLLMAVCLLLFIPLLVLACQCGGADTIFPNQFSDLPFDAKEHLISYHTEGRGEDKEVPLQSVPIMLGIQNKVETAPARNFNGTETHQVTTLYNESVQKFQETIKSAMEVDSAYRFSGESSSHGCSNAVQFNRQRLGVQNTTVSYEDMALPDAFLNDYYSQKMICTVPVMDGLLQYDFEGQSSSAGSVGCCSLQESDSDLHFLNELGPKFKTLAEICSPPTPKPFPTRKVKDVQTTADIAEPVIKPKTDYIETKHANIRTEKVISSTNISKSSVNTLSAEPPSMKRLHSEVTNISQSSNIRHSTTLLHPVQPVYYTTSPVLQPMHYAVQPQLPSMGLSADGVHETNSPGLYVVSGSQSPYSGLTISGPQGSSSGLFIQGIESSASPTSPVSPILILPSSPGVSQGTVPVGGWKIIRPNHDVNYMLSKERSSADDAEGMEPGTSQGTVARDAILVKKAAPPQGVLGPAAQGSVYGILPGHTVAEKGVAVAVTRNLGQTRGGQPEQMGLDTAVIDTVGIRTVDVNQFQGISSLGQTREANGVLKECKLDSHKEDKSINLIDIFTTAETTETHMLSKDKVMMKNLLNNNYSVQKMPNDTDEEMQSEDVMTLTSKQDTTVDDHSEFVKGAAKDEGIQDIPTQVSEESSYVNLTVAEKIGVKIDETEEEGPLSEQQENQEQECFFEENALMITQKSCTDVSLPGSDVIDLVDMEKKKEETSKCTHREGATSTADYINIIDDQIHNIKEESVYRQEAASLKEKERKHFQLSIVEGPEERSCEVGSETQSDEFTVDQSEREQKEADSPVENMVSDVEIHQVITIYDCIQAEENLVEMTTVTSDAHEVVKAEQEELFVSEVGLDTVDDELSATHLNEISKDTVNESEALSEQQVSHSEWDIRDKDHTKTNIANAEEKMSSQTVSTILNNYEEGDLDNLNLISEEITALAQEEGSNVPTISNLEHTTENSSPGNNEEDGDNKQNVTSGLGIGLHQVNANEKSITNGDTEESIVEKGESQQCFSPSDDQDEDNERQNEMNKISQMEDKFIPDDNIHNEEKDEDVKENTVSPVQPNIRHSDDRVEDSTKENASNMSSQMDDALISNDNINVSGNEEELGEEVALPVQQKVTITDDQDEAIASKDESGRSSPLEHQLIADEKINNGKEEGHVVEETTSSTQLHLTISKDRNEETEREDTGSLISQMVNQSITEDNISDGKKEENTVESVDQMTSILDEDQDDEKHTLHMLSQIEDKLILDDSLTDGETEEEDTPPIEQITTISDDDEKSKTDDASRKNSQLEDQLIISSDNTSDGEKEEDLVISPLQQNISIQDDQDEKSVKEDTSGTGSQKEEDGVKSHQLCDSQSIESECSSEVDPHLTIQHAQIIQMGAISGEPGTQEMLCEVTTPQIRQGIDSYQIVHKALDIPERQYTDGQELGSGTNMKGYYDMLKSSSGVTMEQVSMSSEDKKASPRIFASEQEAEGEIIHSDHNADVIKTENYEAEDLILETGEVEISFDQKIKDGLNKSTTSATGQLSPTTYTDMKGEDKTIFSGSSTDRGSSETGITSFTATNTAVEEGGCLVQDKNMEMAREVAGLRPNTLGQAVSMALVSNEPDYIHGAEATVGQVSPVLPQKKSRKSKKDSNKRPQSPKSASGKCKQQ